MKCHRPDCLEDAEWYPLLLLYQDPAIHSGPPKQACVPLPICNDHQAGLSVNDFIGDEYWALVCAGFLIMGLSPPCREATRLTFILVDAEEVLALSSMLTATPERVH